MHQIVLFLEYVCILFCVALKHKATCLSVHITIILPIVQNVTLNIVINVGGTKNMFKKIGPFFDQNAP